VNDQWHVKTGPQGLRLRPSYSRPIPHLFGLKTGLKARTQLETTSIIRQMVLNLHTYKDKINIGC